MDKPIKPLSEEAITDLLNDYIASGVENRIIFGKNVAQKSLENILEQVVEWLNDWCLHIETTSQTQVRRYACRQCWQELKESYEEVITEQKSPFN